MVKGRAYGGDGFSEEEKNAAIYTLHKTLSTILKLLAPITPFITEHLWKTLYGKGSIHKEHLPTPRNYERMTNYTKEIIDFNSNVWNEKKLQKKSLKESIAVPVPPSLSKFKKDFVAMHNLTD